MDPFFCKSSRKQPCGSWLGVIDWVSVTVIPPSAPHALDGQTSLLSEAQFSPSVSRMEHRVRGSLVLHVTQRLASLSLSRDMSSP